MLLDQALISLPLYISSIPTLHWQWFWSLNLVVSQRNVAYRYITGRIATLFYLNSILPAVFSSPHCSLCPLVIESADHLLFECPAKQTVWQAIIKEFLWPTVDTTDIRQSLQTLNFFVVNYSHNRQVSAHMIIFITLAHIWKSHYRSSYDHHRFHPPAVIAIIRSDILRTADMVDIDC